MLIPRQGYLPPVLLHPLSWAAMGYEFGSSLAATSAASAAYPAANHGIFYPFALDLPWTIRKLFIVHGSASTGNVDLGIFSEFGTRIVSTGSQAVGAAGALEAFSISDITLSPGRYYMGVSRSSTGTVYRYAPGSGYAKILGIKNAGSVFPLPDTVTFADPSYEYVPIIGASSAA